MAATHVIGFIVNTANAGDKPEVLSRLNRITARLQGRDPELDTDGSLATHNRWTLLGVFPEIEVSVLVGLPSDLPATIRAEVSAAVGAVPTSSTIEWSDLSASMLPEMTAYMIQHIANNLGANWYWVFGLGDSMAGGLPAQFVHI